MAAANNGIDLFRFDTGWNFSLPVYPALR